MKIDTELIKEIIKKPSFTLIILGISLIIFAAIKNIGEYSIIDTNWRVFIAGVGILLLLLGMILTIKEISSSKKQNIKITLPRNEKRIVAEYGSNGKSINKVLINGTYINEVENCYLFVRHERDSGVHPKTEIKNWNKNNTWDGEVTIGREPPEKCFIFIAKVGNKGLKLIKNYKKDYQKFDLVSDIKKLDEIIVYKV